MTTNPITGLESKDIPFEIPLTTTAMRSGKAATGPQFLMPAVEGTLKLPLFLKMRTLYTPSKETRDLSDTITHVVGLPLAPMERLENHTISVSTFTGYAPDGLEQVGDKDTFLTEPAPKFKALLDGLRDEFLDLFLQDGQYLIGDGPKRTELEDWMTAAIARLGGLKDLARGTPVPENIVPTTFVVGNTDVVLPAVYDTGSEVGSTITVKLDPADAVKLRPKCFQVNPVRYSYIGWQQVLNYFDLGMVAPLALRAMFETYGPDAKPQSVTTFLETVMTQVNATGKYAYGVTPSSSDEKASMSSAAAMVYEMFEQIILYLTFVEIQSSLTPSDLFGTVKLRWENEFADEYGADVMGNDADHMAYIGCPNDDDGGPKIHALPYYFWINDGNVPDESKAKRFALVRLRSRPLKNQKWLMSCTNFDMPVVGWDVIDGQTAGIGSVHAEFDPQVGLICDTKSPAFLDLVVKGDIFAGWLRARPYDSPQQWKLAISRNLKQKYSIGLGPMTLLDPVVGRRGVFSGNILPFDVGKPHGAQLTVITGGKLTYIVDPAKVLARSIAKPPDGKVE